MFQTKSLKKIKTRILRSITLVPKITLFMRLCKKNMVEPDMPRWQYNAVQKRCKNTDTHSQYLILIFFRGSNGFANAPVLHYTCIVCLVYITFLSAIRSFDLNSSLHLWSAFGVDCLVSSNMCYSKLKFLYYLPQNNRFCQNFNLSIYLCRPMKN